MVSDLREAVIDEAGTWIGTPYCLNAQAKGVGVDCHRLLAAAYATIGLSIHVPVYSSWDEAVLAHRGEKLASTHLFKVMHEIEFPQRGDTALFKFSGSYVHGAIVVEWPVMIDAWRTVAIRDASRGIFERRKIKFLTPNKWSN